MALYHLHVSAGNKSSGASGSIRHDYVTRSGAYADRAGELVVTESGNLPSWAQGAADFWSAADEHERSNGRVYSEIEFALPRELSSEQRIELARSFAREVTVGHQLPYTLAIHDRDSHNPHAHLLYSERCGDGLERPRAQHFRRANRQHPERGGAPKAIEMRGAEWVRAIRAEWEDAANRALAQAQHSERIDARSYEERSIEQTPQLHLGVSAAAMERRGAGSRRGDLWREREEMRRLEVSLSRAEQKLADRLKVTGWMKELEVNRARKRREDALRREAREKAQEAREGAKRTVPHQKAKESLSEAPVPSEAEKRAQRLREQVRDGLRQGGRLEYLKPGRSVRGIVLEGEVELKGREGLYRILSDEKDPSRFVAFPAGSKAAREDFAQPGRRVKICRHSEKQNYHFAMRLSQERDRGMDR